MFTKNPILNYLQKHAWAPYALVFLIYLVIHVVIFRDILGAVPAILQGKAVLVREELIPFFSFESQFWPTDTSQLTLSDEMRVLYSFWTSWVRHYAVLPFALVLLNTAAATILFYAFYRLGRLITGHKTWRVMVAASLAAFLIHFILLYAKVTHFYTLVFGFSLFAMALSLVLEQLFFKQTVDKRNMLLTAALVLFNPAIHYHVIFYLILVFLVLLQIAFTYGLNRKHIGSYIKRNAIYASAVIALSLLPYLVLIFLIGGSSASSAADNVPINYWLIYYWSLPLTSLLSLDTAAQIDLFRYGSYVIPTPRVFGMAVMFIVGSLFIFKEWKQLLIARRLLVLALFVTLLMSLWMAMGYSSSGFSFHHAISGLALFLNEQANGLAQLLAQGIATFVNILRFPHRFQFIFFYVVGVLFTVGLFWIGERVREKRGARLGILAMVGLALLPILSARDYSTVLTSGNFAGYLQPYQISPDLPRIREELAKSTDDRLFMLPTMESGRDMRANGYDYSFIDKFFLFYLNQPTLYYGTDVKPEHKFISYSVYRAIADKQPRWDTILRNSLGVTHILQPKQLHMRSVGSQYMPGIMQKIDKALESSKLYTKTYEGADFTLYKATTPVQNNHTLVDIQWEDLTSSLDNVPKGQLYFPLQLTDFNKLRDNTFLMSDSVERSFYTLYTSRNNDNTFYPSTVPLAFSKELIASSTFSANTLSMDVLNDKNNAYNYLHTRMPGLLNTQTAQFMGVSGGNKGIQLKIDAPQAGKYRLVLHAASQKDELVSAVSAHSIVLNKITDDTGKHQDYMDMTYFTADVKLAAGKHTITLHNPGDSALAVESLSLVPAQDIPDRFDGNINHAGIHLTSLDKKTMFSITLEANDER